MTFSIHEIIKEISVHFPNNRNNKIEERRKKVIKPEDVKYREIRYLNMGTCFEISLEQFDEPLGYIEFFLKMSGAIYVNLQGQFHDRDSISKMEVKKGSCLWIEVTYEVINRTLEEACRR